jgi:hypothetical protein
MQFGTIFYMYQTHGIIGDWRTPGT